MCNVNKSVILMIICFPFYVDVDVGVMMSGLVPFLLQGGGVDSFAVNAVYLNLCKGAGKGGA